MTGTPDLIMSSRKWTPETEIVCFECGHAFRGRIKGKKSNNEWLCLECLEAMLAKEDEREVDYIEDWMIGYDGVK